MLKRISIPAVAALLLLVVTVLAGCGSGGGTSGTVPLNSIPEAHQTTPAQVTLNVFLVKGETVSQVTRTTQTSTDLVQQALADMLAGPTEAEKTQGFSTAIPAGTRLLSYQLTNGKATADFSKEMLSFGGGSSRVQAILGQVSNTITANDPAVKTVSVTVEGKPADEVLQP